MHHVMRNVLLSVLASLASAPAAAAPAAGPIDALAKALDANGASRDPALVAARIAAHFARLAGSEDNALALVNALRHGEAVRLVYPPASPGGTPLVARLEPSPTGRIGWGQVLAALLLAQERLERLGLGDPPAEQLHAALLGGEVAATARDGSRAKVALPGVLQLRADGQGWDVIAKLGGARRGPLLARLRMANARVAALPAASSRDGGPKVARMTVRAF